MLLGFGDIALNLTVVFVDVSDHQQESVSSLSQVITKIANKKENHVSFRTPS